MKSRIVFGVNEPLPLRGFPPGRARIRQRNKSFAQVFIRPESGGIRKFIVEEKDGAWVPVAEIGSNAVAKTTA